MGRGRGRTPVAVDAHVGQLIRQRRTLLGITRSELADTVGVTYQQLRNYERGESRVAAGRLNEIARALRCAPGDLFPPSDWLEPDTGAAAVTGGRADLSAAEGPEA